jgi:hypothetical protein
VFGAYQLHTHQNLLKSQVLRTVLLQVVHRSSAHAQLIPHLPLDTRKNTTNPKVELEIIFYPKGKRKRNDCLLKNVLIYHTMAENLPSGRKKKIPKKTNWNLIIEHPTHQSM